MPTPQERYIVHVDMDAFFAACEQRDNPEYAGKPVIVGSDPKGGRGRGVVSTCSYEARKYGIHSGQAISIAYRKCPAGIFLPVDMAKYIAASDNIFTIFERFTPEIEPISIDEAFLDITGSAHLFGGPLATCRKIKRAIKKEIGLTASAGMAPNMMTAKIASDIDKPDGLTVVTPDGLLPFLHALEVDKLWGIGAKTNQALKEMSINTIGDLARKDYEELVNIFGKNGSHIWKLANGIDPRHVETEGSIKSIGNEHTFDTDTRDKHKIMDTLMFLSEKVSRRLRKDGFKGTTITLRIRLSDFKTYTRSITLNTPTNFADIIYKNVVDKLVGAHCNTPLPRDQAVRLVGVRVSNLVDAFWQNDLFSDTRDARKTEQIHKALDKIKDRFGERSIKRRR